MNRGRMQVPFMLFRASLRGAVAVLRGRGGRVLDYYFNDCCTASGARGLEELPAPPRCCIPAFTGVTVPLVQAGS